MSDTTKIKAVYGLSAMQKSMLLNYAIDETSDAYVEQFDFKIVGKLNTEYMQQALIKVSEHYDILRTVFSYRNTDEPYQIVLKELTPPFQVIDFTDELDIQTSITNFKEEDRKRGFQLSTESPLRACVIKEEETRWRFILTFHHIIMDGWSLGPLFQTLVSYYEELVSTRSCISKHEEYHYKDYISWVEKQDDSEAKQYWKDYLEGYEKEVGLTGFDQTKAYNNTTHKFSLSDDLYDAMKQFVKDKCITQNILFQVVWGILLQKFNYTEDVVFGAVVSGRTAQVSGTENMVGLFVNTQPIRIQFDEQSTFESVCKNVQSTNFRSMPYEYYPLYDIQRDCALKNKLINHVIAFENYPLADKLQDFSSSDNKGLKFEGVEVFERTNYDFHVVVNPGNTFGITFTYNKLLYCQDFIHTLERSIIKILQEVMKNPKTQINDICICSAYDKDKILNEFQMPAIPYCKDKNVVQLFREAVSKYGDKVALAWKEKEYTYKDVDRWSDHFVRKLQQIESGIGVGIGLMTEHTPEMVIGMLGILKSGNYFVPIDVKDSDQRLDIILSDANINVVCTTEELAKKVSDKHQAILIDDFDSIGNEKITLSEFDEIEDTADVAYMMYTSGSTGKAKGCNITHQNIVRLVFEQNYYDFNDKKVVLQTGSPAFDACTFEIWGTLLHGSKLVLTDEINILDGSKLKEVIRDYNVTTMWLTASLFNQLCDFEPELFRTLEYLLVGGSALSTKHISKVKKACPQLKVINGYGPTENTTFSTTHLIEDEDLLLERIPIGKPLNHSSAFVLDKGYNLLPIGCVGELCVGGDGVALGYHNRPDMTAERFINIPALTEGTLYRTGDLSRWLPTGVLDYIGREDNQVKIRGFRVEVSEIENVINEIKDIQDAAVIVKEIGSEKRLFAFYVAKQVVTPEKIKTELSRKLSNYMIPLGFIQLESLPLNKNGKVDKEKLSILYKNAEEQISVRNKSMSDIEKMVFQIVADVLGTENYDINGNFFDIGITSLNLITINNRLRKALDKEIPLTVLFEQTSVVSLAEYIEHMDQNIFEDEEEKVIEEDSNEEVDLLIRLMDDSE